MTKPPRTPVKLALSVPLVRKLMGPPLTPAQMVIVAAWPDEAAARASAPAEATRIFERVRMGPVLLNVLLPLPNEKRSVNGYITNSLCPSSATIKRPTVFGGSQPLLPREI